MNLISVVSLKVLNELLLLILLLLLSHLIQNLNAFFTEIICSLLNFIQLLSEVLGLLLLILLFLQIRPLLFLLFLLRRWCLACLLLLLQRWLSLFLSHLVLLEKHDKVFPAHAVQADVLRKLCQDLPEVGFLEVYFCPACLLRRRLGLDTLASADRGQLTHRVDLALSLLVLTQAQGLHLGQLSLSHHRQASLAESALHLGSD